MYLPGEWEVEMCKTVQVKLFWPCNRCFACSKFKEELGFKTTQKLQLLLNGAARVVINKTLINNTPNVLASLAIDGLLGTIQDAGALEGPAW